MHSQPCCHSCSPICPFARAPHAPRTERTAGTPHTATRLTRPSSETPGCIVTLGRLSPSLTVRLMWLLNPNVAGPSVRATLCIAPPPPVAERACTNVPSRSAHPVGICTGYEHVDFGPTIGTFICTGRAGGGWGVSMANDYNKGWTCNAATDPTTATRKIMQTPEGSGWYTCYFDCREPGQPHLPPIRSVSVPKPALSCYESPFSFLSLFSRLVLPPPFIHSRAP